MGLKENDTWDRGHGNMGCWGECIGTVPVRVSVQERLVCGDIPSVKKVEQINKIDFINAGGIDFESEEIEDFLNDDSILIGVEDSPFNMDEDILFLKSLLSENPIPPHPIIPNQTKLAIEETNHSLNMGYEHFNTNLSTEPVNDNSSNFTIISNPLFDNDKINSDEINSHVESNSDESKSNHDDKKSDYLDEFYGPFIPIHILEEERTRREHADYINRMEMLFTINSFVRNVIVKFDARVKFDIFNDEKDDLSYFMFVIFAKEFSLLSAESEDMIFDLGISE
nr:hypothetical protein [Tanacetum cinerariifolium]